MIETSLAKMKEIHGKIHKGEIQVDDGKKLMEKVIASISCPLSKETKQLTPTYPGFSYPGY